MRLFIGVQISEEARNKISEFQRQLKKRIPEARLVRPENLHLTLKFLGEVPENQQVSLAGVIEETAARFPTFRMVIQGIGRFPGGKNVRVSWVGADSGDVLAKLNKELEAGLEKLGFARENRFQEHVTVARFKSIPNLSALAEIEDRYRDERWGETAVSELALMESKLRPEGPLYTTVQKFPLSRSSTSASP